MNDDERPPSMLRLLRPADYVSLTNAVAGLAAIVAAIQGEIWWSYGFILAGVLLDGVDGAVARFSGSGPLGSYLDTMSDLVVFVAAPSVLVYLVFRDDVWSTWIQGLPPPVAAGLASAAAILFLVAGLARLARFEWLDGGERSDYFLGLTTPGGAILAAAGSLWVSAESDSAGPAPVGLALVVLGAILMTTRMRLPKLRGPLVLPSILVILAAMALGPYFAGAGPMLLVLFTAAYVLFGSSYLKRQAVREPGAHA